MRADLHRLTEVFIAYISKEAPPGSTKQPALTESSSTLAPKVAELKVQMVRFEQLLQQRVKDKKTRGIELDSD